ncbi:MAG: proton-conducting transporter membrane subunit, partial [Verrucomicrobiae bacterium]|nr:proton-conducting transporter membrane subunit [Verrucomicrobiae bacterium]
MIEQLSWGILSAPLGAAVFIVLFGLKRPVVAGALSVGAAGCTALLSLLVLIGTPWRHAWETNIDWFVVGNLAVSIGLRFDAISTTMTVVVAWVALLIHFYSLGYMRGDPGFGRYFAGLSLFLFAMLLIVLATNLVQLFVGWELVGVSSYLLIGFWFQRPGPAEASKKAFLVNRLGDFGFLAGLMLIWGKTGTLNLGELNALVADQAVAMRLSPVAGLLIFCGVLGKSAQFPLHVWLPDAM